MLGHPDRLIGYHDSARPRHSILYKYACGQCTADLYLPVVLCRQHVPHIRTFKYHYPYMAGLLVTHWVRTPGAPAHAAVQRSRDITKQKQLTEYHDRSHIGDPG